MANKIGISLDDETLQLCDRYAAEHSRSRSEFIAMAIQKYVSELELGRQKNIIAEELADELVKSSEAGVTKISKGMFRYAVENDDKYIDVSFEMNGDFTNSTMIILEPMFEKKLSRMP